MASKTSKIIADLRKPKGWSQTELATNSSVSREMIGKYELGEAVNASFDKKNFKRLQDIEKLDTDVKDKIYFLLIVSFRTLKLKKF